MEDKSFETTSNQVKMYYGAHEIINVEDVEGLKRVEVKFANPKENADGSKDTGEKFSIPEWELLVCVTGEPCSEIEHLSELRNRRANHIVKKILELLKEHNIKVEELSFYMQKLLLSMNMNEDKAIAKAFGVDSKDDVRIGDWDRVLKS